MRQLDTASCPIVKGVHPDQYGGGMTRQIFSVDRVFLFLPVAVVVVMYTPETGSLRAVWETRTSC